MCSKIQKKKWFCIQKVDVLTFTNLLFLYNFKNRVIFSSYNCVFYMKNVSFVVSITAWTYILLYL